MRTGKGRSVNLEWGRDRQLDVVWNIPSGREWVTDDGADM